MSERKNHLTIDGGVVKEDEHVASYKPIPEADADFRKSKTSLSKSKEKVTADEAEEKLLDKEEEAKIVTRVDMADAKYVVGDHRNGDAKIELDANKREFSGLTKEELLRYADDPFWVRLRWCMFILFWALWLAMLAGAIAIIVRAPKCYPPPPKTWYEKGPLVDMSMYDNYNGIEDELATLQQAKVEGIFTRVCLDSYEVLDTPDCLQKFKDFNTKAKKHDVKVIVDLTANFVPKGHKWFLSSEAREEQYKDYFIWAPVGDRDESGAPKPPNNWVSTLNKPAWTYSEKRNESYLHQYGQDSPDLNFHHPEVKKHFEDVLVKWMQAGADGVRLWYARELLVNMSLGDEAPATGAGSSPAADHASYLYWRHKLTSDQPDLDPLLDSWAKIVDANAATPNIGSSVFTIRETGPRPELFLLDRARSLRPASARAVPAAPAAPQHLAARLPRWPAIQLGSSVDESENSPELAAFSLLLPAAPVLRSPQLSLVRNDTNHLAASKSFQHLVSLRSDATILHGNYSVSAAPANNSTLTVLACARWKPGHTGYLAVYNPHQSVVESQLDALPTVPADVVVLHVSDAVREETNYTTNQVLRSERVLIPGKSTVVLSYVPNVAAEI